MPSPRTLAAVLLVAHALMLGALCFSAKLTVDEANYVLAGAHLRQHLDWAPYNTILHGPLALFPNQMFAWVADPHDFAAYLPWARLGLVPFSVLAGLGVYVLARRGFGAATGVAALFVWCTNPIVLANGCLATADMALACGAVWTLERAWAWVQAPSLRRALGLGAALGATLATKYLALFLVPTLGVVLACRVLHGGRAGFGRRGLTALGAAGVVTLAAWLTLHTCYLWAPGGYTITQTASHLAPEDPRAGPQSTALRAMLRTAPGRALLPTLPAPFVRGIDYQQHVAQYQTTSFGDRIGPGFWGYYATALGLKLPLATLALLALGLLRRTPTRAAWSRLMLGAGIAVPLLLLSGFTQLQIGVRYALSVVPLLSVVAGRGLAGLLAPPRQLRLRLAAGVLGLSLVGGTLAAWPGYLTVFNWLAPQPYLWFRDSTLDWRVPSQPDPDRDALLARHEGAVLGTARTGPMLGGVVLHGDQLGPADPRDPARVHHWLRRFGPVDRAGAWFAFDVDASEFNDLTHAAGAPRGRAEFAAALLGAGDLDGARMALRKLDDPLATVVRAGVAVVEGGDAIAQAHLWRDLGRPDLLTALGDRAPVAIRAQGLFQAGDLAGVIELLLPTAQAGALPSAEVYLLAAVLRELGRGREALVLLEAMTPGPDERGLHDQLMRRLREELDAAMTIERNR